MQFRDAAVEQRIIRNMRFLMRNPRPLIKRFWSKATPPLASYG